MGSSDCHGHGERHRREGVLSGCISHGLVDRA